MAVLGYKPSGAAQGLAVNGDNFENYFAYVPDPATQNGWAYSMGARLGPRDAGDNPDVRLIVLDTDPNPDDVIIATDTFTPTVQMTSGSEGDVYEEALTSVMRVHNSRRYALSAQAINARLGLGMIEAAAYVGRENYLFYYRTDSTFPPVSPMGYTRTQYAGHAAIWLNYEPNVAPNTPGDLAPADGSLQTTFTPTFTGNFRDDNEAIPGFSVGDADKLSAFDIEVYNDDTGAKVWGLYDEAATTSERTARAFSRVYAGSVPLASGTDYRWRCRVADEFGSKSSWTSWLYFTAGSGKVVVTSATPNGKQETRTPGPFVAQWTHTGGLTASRARVIIRNENGTIVRQIASGGYVTLSPAVAANANASVSWAALAFADLVWGGTYTWEMSLYDSSGAWSAYSDRVAFTVNAAPSVPTNLSPSNDEAFSSRPTISCQCVDTDDTVATGLVVKVIIENDDTDTVVGTFSMSLKSGTTDTWELALTGTHLAGYAAYKFRCYAGDGTLWSGNQTIEANAVKSGEARFVYAAGPTVTITSPSDGADIATSTPSITWTAADQAVYRVSLELSDGSASVYNSNDIVSGLQTHAIPSGYLEDGGSYRVRVRVVDTLSLAGNSDWHYFTVTYVPPPDIEGFAGSPMLGDGDIDPSLVLLVWNEADPGGNTPEYINITREPSSDTPVDVDDYGRDSRKIRLARFSDFETTRFVDHTAPSGITMVYRISSYVRNGEDLIRSQLASVQVRLDFEHAVLHQVPDGSYEPEHRIVLPYRDGDLRIEPINDVTFWEPMGKSKPLSFQGDTFYREIKGSFRLYTGGDVEALRSIERNLFYMFKGVNPLLWRDSRRNRIFCKLTKAPLIYPPNGGIARVELELREVDMSEIYE